MFEVGFSEILLIFGIALLVLGPSACRSWRRLSVAGQVARRAMARQLRTQLEQEVQYDPLADTGPARSAPVTRPSSRRRQRGRGTRPAFRTGAAAIAGADADSRIDRPPWRPDPATVPHPPG
jgi:Sec-independent protein translocase protein TatA